jgi:hypothetical protein
MLIITMRRLISIKKLRAERDPQQSSISCGKNTPKKSAPSGKSSEMFLGLIYPLVN